MTSNVSVPAPLEVLWGLRLRMHLGISVSTSLMEACNAHKSLYARSLKNWVGRLEAGQRTRDVVLQLPELTKTSGRRAFLMILERGVMGSSIDGALQDLETEFLEIVERSFEKHLQILPLKLVFPLAVFILPAVILVLVGPLLANFKSLF